MTFRVESSRDQYSVSVDTVGQKMEIDKHKNLQIQNGWWIQVQDMLLIWLDQIFIHKLFVFF
jgi:hypothetical protein